MKTFEILLILLNIAWLSIFKKKPVDCNRFKEVTSTWCWSKSDLAY